MRPFILPCLLLSLTLPVFSQSLELGGFGGAHRINPNRISPAADPNAIGASETFLNNGWLFGFRMTINQGDWFGHEFGYTYNRTALDFRAPGSTSASSGATGMAIHRSGYNFLLYAVPEGKKIRPFVTGGGQFSNFVPPGASAAQGGGENKWGINYGVGLKYRVSERYMIRTDYRRYVQGRPFGRFIPVESGSFHNNEISLGFSFTL
jgi:opacity protein-like surface antigen